MDDDQFFDLAFISIASIRFHPRNIPQGVALGEAEHNELDLAYAAATEMTNMRKKSCPHG